MNRFLASAFFDWVVRFVVIVALAISFLSYNNQQKLSGCVARWADDYTAVQTSRSNANTERNDALNTLLRDALISPAQGAAAKSQENLILALTSGDLAKISAAANQRLTDLRAANSDPKLAEDTTSFIRADQHYRDTVVNHPLPDPPREVCK